MSDDSDDPRAATVEQLKARLAEAEAAAQSTIHVLAQMPHVDRRRIAIARTQVELGFLAAAKAVEGSEPRGG